jgi:hypothetical protein
MEQLLLQEKHLWMIHKVSRNNIPDLELIRILLLVQSIVRFQPKRLVKMFVSLWTRMKRLLDQYNISTIN